MSKCESLDGQCGNSWCNCDEIRALFPLVRRFQRCRWSNTRNRIHSLKLGESITVPATEFNNATTSIQRLKEAYEHTRAWRMRKINGGWKVESICAATVECKDT